MNRLVIVARLQEGKHEEAEALLRGGPPFDPEEFGLHRHSAYLTTTEVAFFFEATEVEWVVNDLIDNPVVGAALGPWRTITEGPPRLAHERYFWTREESKTGVGLGL